MYAKQTKCNRYEPEGWKWIFGRISQDKQYLGNHVSNTTEHEDYLGNNIRYISCEI